MFRSLRDAARAAVAVALHQYFLQLERQEGASPVLVIEGEVIILRELNECSFLCEWIPPSDTLPWRVRVECLPRDTEDSSFSHFVVHIALPSGEVQEFEWDSFHREYADYMATAVDRVSAERV